MRLLYENRSEELLELAQAGRKFNVVIDLRNDQIVVTDSKLRRYDTKLCDFSFLKGTKKEVSEFNRAIKACSKRYTVVCKSTVAKTYGKDVAEQAPVYSEVDNPYYKCSSPMKLYIKESLDYLYGYRELQR